MMNEREGIKDYRRRFIRRLRGMRASAVRVLLHVETPEELRAMRDACLPEGDEAMRGLIDEELAGREGVESV